MLSLEPITEDEAALESHGLTPFYFEVRISVCVHIFGSQKFGTPGSQPRATTFPGGVVAGGTNNETFEEHGHILDKVLGRPRQVEIGTLEP